MIVKIAAAVVVCFGGWAYMRMKPPAARVCGSPGGPAVTSPRVKLSDGRRLSYREWGVSKKEAKYKIIMVHALDCSKDLITPVSQELIEELQIYILSFDRAGYGESDPHPERTVKTEAFDVKELADKLEIGPKFYVIGSSMGGYTVWSCLKYIPHRLSGVSLIVPVVNYWWPCLPADLAKENFELLLVQDQWSLRVARYAPRLFYWWMNQKLFPSLSWVNGKMEDKLSTNDFELLKTLPPISLETLEKVRQQGVHESLYRDIMAVYGKWEFDPLDITNPWPDNDGAAHIWQGLDDKIVPYKINKFISEKLPFVQYHEVPGKGHLLALDTILCEEIFRTLLVG